MAGARAVADMSAGLPELGHMLADIGVERFFV
jgi:hypothetical protein